MWFWYDITQELLFLFCSLGAVVREEVSVGQFTTLLANLEKDIQQWVKPAVETSLGKLGTAIDEFFKLKEGMQEIEQQLSLRDVVSFADRTSPRVNCVAGSVASVPMPGESGGSEMPSEFWKRTMVPSGLESSRDASSTKPGKNSQKFM